MLPVQIYPAEQKLTLVQFNNVIENIIIIIGKFKYRSRKIFAL